MADVEIFVDGIATSTLKSFNAYIENLKGEIIGKYPDANGDYTLQTLESSLVNEGDFFCHKTHKTWDTILKDIRKNHEHYIDNIADNNENILSIQRVRQIIISSGNNIDKFIEVFCNSLGIKYKRVSENEKESFRKLLKKSPSIKNSGINFRKRKK